MNIREKFGCVVALTTFLIGTGSYAEQNQVGTTTTHGDPSQIVRQALLPLFQQKKGADQNETRLFSPELKMLADQYFAVGDNARNFDADWLLGMQDWSGQTPSFSTFILDDGHAKVQVSFKPDRKYASADDQARPPNTYTVLFDKNIGWRIDDIAYSEGITLRGVIAHDAWCRRAFRDSTKLEQCQINSWR